MQQNTGIPGQVTIRTR